MTKSRGRRARRQPWSEVDLQLLREFYADTRTDLIAEVVQHPLDSVYRKAKALGLRKSEAYLASADACRLRRGDNVGAPYRFKPGQTPANKGLRRPGWAPGDMAKTQFKKGRAAHEARNYVPIGSYHISKDGYLEQKVTDDPTLVTARRWVPVHRMVWIEANGPVPAGHVVSFKPGRRTAELELITIDALELLTLADNLKRNSLYRYPREIVQAIQLRGVLTRQINKRAKAEEPHEQ